MSRCLGRRVSESGRSLPTHSTESGPVGSHPTGSRPRVSKTLLAVLAVSVVVVVVLGVVLWIRVVPSVSTGGPVSFAGAVRAASGVLDSGSWSGWNISGAEGISVTVPFSLNNSLMVLGCNVTSGAFGPTNYPAGDGNYSSGATTLWILSYLPPHEPGSTLWIQVVNGRASELGAAEGGKCSGYGGNGVGDVVDSSVAMQSILATVNGTRFGQTFPTANETLSLGPGSSPTWTVSLNACGRYVEGPGALLASVWALNGTIQNPPREPAVISC